MPFTAAAAITISPPPHPSPSSSSLFLLRRPSSALYAKPFSIPPRSPIAVPSISTDRSRDRVVGIVAGASEAAQPASGDSDLRSIEFEEESSVAGGGGEGPGGGAGDGSGDGNGSGSGGGSGDSGEEESDKDKKKEGPSMSQKLTLGYAALVGVGGLMGYVKGGSQKSLAAGGMSAMVLLYVYTQLPIRPAIASSVGLGLSAALLVVMGTRFKKSGKVFPAGVVSLVSLIMTGGYLHGILRSSHA